jgi:hypothetical protein
VGLTLLIGLISQSSLRNLLGRFEDSMLMGTLTGRTITVWTTVSCKKVLEGIGLGGYDLNKVRL